MDNWVNLLPVLILAAACMFIMAIDDWKKSILGYALIYISAFSIIVQYWSFSFSMVKLLSGLISLVVLGMSIYRRFEISETKPVAERVFRLVALSLVYTLILFIAYRISNYLSIPLEIVLSSLLIIGFAVIQLGVAHEAYKIFMAILALFFGFELIFSSNEASLLVNGLLAVVTLLVALIGSYMIVNEFEGEES